MDESESSQLSKVEKGITFYASASWLRTTIIGATGAIGIAIPAVPAIVGAVDVALTTKAQQIAERRLKVLCQSWEDEMQSIPSQAVDKDYIESEEFFDLIFRAWESTKRTRHDDKIRLYARLMTNTVSFQNRQEHSPEDYLTVLSELTPKEIEVAQAIFNQQREKQRPDEDKVHWLIRIGAMDFEDQSDGHGQWKKLLIECPTVDENDIEFVLLRLQRSGLVSELNGTYHDYTGGVFVVNYSFRKLMEYLERTVT